MNITNTYGLEWEDRYAQIDVEMAMIRFGGYFPHPDTGFMCGKGLFHHYKALQVELWGDTEDHHRWSDLELKTILENRFTAIMGSRDSGKTHVALSRFALTDYFTFPNTTLILISSTDSRGLELRVWGDMKDLFDRAKGRHPWLPGNIVDAKKGLFTDALDSNNEIRDMRKGIIGIPCLGNKGEWTGGLNRYVGIKQKRRRLLADECFPAGTLVDTPYGAFPIETLEAGDFIYSAAGTDVVVKQVKRYSPTLVRLSFSDGRKMECTPEHRILTEEGWINAIDISLQTRIITSHEAMQIMRENSSIPSRQEGLLQRDVQARSVETKLRMVQEVIHPIGSSWDILYSVLSREMETLTAGNRIQNDCRERPEGGRESNSGSYSEQSKGKEAQIGIDVKAIEQTVEEMEKDWDDGVSWLRSDSRAVTSRSDSCGIVSRGKAKLQNLYGKIFKAWECSTILAGLRVAGNQIGCGSGRSVPQQAGTADKGCGADQVFDFVTLESIEVLERGSDPRYNESEGGYPVYNIQALFHPSYSVSGILVHNCQFMQPPFLNALANLDKGDFKAVAVGNPIGQGDPLDKMAEPIGGWDSIGEVTKTLTWKNKFGGVTINLVGTDSPNFDKETWSKYPYLIDQSDVERVKERYGADSMQFWSQIMGVRKAGLDAHRVLTRALCERNDAYKEVIWDGGESRIKVYALDAAFGGDRCVGGWVEFGKETNGPIVIRVNPPREIQLEMSSGKTLEEQIAQSIKDEIILNGIPSANVFFDAGMRATLATEISKVVGTDVNAVNFQGNPTARPVSADDFVFDEKSQSKRHKRCDEHYSKFVTELWFSVRYAVLSRQIREFPTQVAEEFFMREWIKVTGDRYEIESKKDMKERVGYSPDLADWMAIAVEGARRLGFVIERMAGEDTKRTELDDWLEREVSQHRQMMRKTQLTYT